MSIKQQGGTGFRSWAAHAPWIFVASLGLAALAHLARSRGEHIGALWIIGAAVSTYLVAYRYYSRFIADKLVRLDDSRLTPAHRHPDGLDFVPTNRYVLFGHHFAAIAGAGPLVGPVLAAQMGYLPGSLWIIAGAVLAGAVQDFLVLTISMRHDGRSFGDLARCEMGVVAGTIVLFGAYAIMVIILAVLALIVVRALAHSPWGLVSVVLTIPVAIIMGMYGRWVRPGRIIEVSVIGFVGLIGSILVGQFVAASPTSAPFFTLSPVVLCYSLIAYGAVAAVVPVWMLLAPRDYLSTFLKLGAIFGLTLAIAIVQPTLQMPAVTRFAVGNGPVWSGSLFPFLFITIACGAVSGFHALIASGTTPKMIAKETDARFIGYGAMLVESFVAIVALICASVVDPGVYFAMNSPAAIVGSTPISAAAAVTSMGYSISPTTISETARSVGESSIISRSGGAPTLAVAMAQLFSQVLGGRTLMAFWYHFAILFEAMFILTAIDAGTRAGRFMIQDLIGTWIPWIKRPAEALPALMATGLCVASWGYFLYQGVTDPLGGINALWPLFGISNQMLAAMAFLLATVVLFRGKHRSAAWIAALPATWLLICTSSAACLKIWSGDPKVGFFAHASILRDAMDHGIVVAPAKSLGDLQRMAVNDYVDGTLCAIFLIAVLCVTAFAIQQCLSAQRSGFRSDLGEAISGG